MSGSNDSLNLGNTDETLSVLTGSLESFIETWEAADEPPIIEKFLPHSGPRRRLILTELIKVDLEYRWQQRNLPRRISEYLEEFPELREEGVPADLLYEEFHIRQQCGLTVDPLEYLDQFPDQSEEIRCLLGLDRQYESTALFNGIIKLGLDHIQSGEQLDDFDLLAHLGRGAFATVFLARQRSMQRLVALKISADLGDEPRTLAQLDHDFIVRVFDHRKDDSRNLRMLYMQYVPGGTLHDVIHVLKKTKPSERTGSLLLNVVKQTLEERGESRAVESSVADKLKKMDWPETVCWIGSRLALALDYASRLGVLHRDVKPANVLLTAEGVPKLADFNTSFSSQVTGATPAAYFGGSLAYMSPEQLEAFNPLHEREPDSLDEKSDHFSLGVLLWELLTGARPFADGNLTGDWFNDLRDITNSRNNGIEENTLSNVPVDCPAGLIRVLKKCLAPRPGDRWSTGAELAGQLELCRKPRAEAILYPVAESLCRKLRGFIIPAVIVLAMIPNILAGVFNYFYNREFIVENLQDAMGTFWTIQTVINAVAYPVGLGLLGYLTWTMVRVVRDRQKGAAVSTQQLALTRKRSLRLGHYAAMIGLVEWTIAGIAYPISIHFSTGTMTMDAYLHFFGSLLLCGLIAVSYPFFGISYLGIRVIYPCLLHDGLSVADDSEILHRLGRLCWRYLVMALLVPMLGVAALVLMNLDARFVLGILSVGGTLGAGLVFWLFRQLQDDLDVLSEAFRTE